MVPALFAYAEIRRPKMQMSGGHLLPPVQILVATLIFAFMQRQNANESPAGSDGSTAMGSYPKETHAILGEYLSNNCKLSFFSLD